MADTTASVLAKLRNKAKTSNISYQQCLQLFVQEEFLRRLSKSGFDNLLILKGGLFIYTLTNFESRATIDIGVGDIIVPKAETRIINTQLPGFESPIIKTYSLESTIAEKFDAILQRYELTGRMKDFYDIYYLANTFEFDGAKLQNAIFETLQRRGTPYDKDSFKRVTALADDNDILKRWRYFLKNVKDNSLDFSVVIADIKSFLEPIYEAIINETEWQNQWTPATQWNKK